MISLGSVVWGSAPKIPMSFEYEKQRSGADMKYRVKVTIDPITGTHYFGYPIYLTLTIAGTAVVSGVTLKTATPKQWESAIVYTSDWHTVSNKTSGTTAVSLKVYSGQGSTRNETYSYSMGVDPAASKLSVSDGTRTLGKELVLSMTKYNTSFTHNITYQCGTDSGEVCHSTSLTTVEWVPLNGNTVVLARQNPNGQSVDVTFTLTTYDWDTVVGTDIVTVTMAIPASVKPSVSLKVEDAAGHLATYGAYVQGKSKLKITATPTLAYGSPIKTYSITADGKTYHTSQVTTDVIQGKDKLAVTAVVTDNRSYSSDVASTEITVLEYSKPAINVIAYRCNSSGEEDPEGAYMIVGFTSTITSLNGKNSASYTITYSGGSPITGTGTSYTSGPIESSVDAVRSVEVTVTDDLDSTTKAAVIPIAFTLMDFYHTGMGVAFGKIATRDGFDCAMPAYFTGDVHIGDKTLAQYIKDTVNS